jgi:mannose-1-phosphate guanylyltransferase
VVLRCATRSMRAVILAGGEGTRLRPLTLGTPKPVVPVVDRPFLRHQLDLLASADVRDVVFSVAYRPERVEAVFGDGAALGMSIRYAVEPSPLGTGGAVRHALPLLDERTIVMNGDVLTDVDLPRLVRQHQERGASATILLTPVANPAAYGLVETDASGRVLRFVEKPEPQQITTDTINAGIYILETRVVELIPPAVKHSIERGFFPALLGRGDMVLGPVHRGYWIDIGTPAKYLQVHRDILRRRFPVVLEAEPRDGGFVALGARVAEGVALEPPFFVGPGCEIESGVRLGPDAVLVGDVRLRAGARVRDSVVWPGGDVGAEASLETCLLGPGVRVDAHARVRGAVLGEGTLLSSYSSTGEESL